MHLNSREIRKLNVETIFNRRRLWRCCRCCLNCLLLFGRRASLCTFDRLFVRLCRTNYSSINSRRHASLWSTHRIGWEDNKQTTATMGSSSETMELRGRRGGLSSTPDRAIRVRALPGDTVLCSWVRHLTLTAPLSTQVFALSWA